MGWGAIWLGLGRPAKGLCAAMLCALFASFLRHRFPIPRHPTNGLTRPRASALSMHKGGDASEKGSIV